MDDRMIPLRKITHILERFAKPSRIEIARNCHLDDFAMKPPVTMIWWHFVVKIFFRFFPPYLRISFPTRAKMARNYLKWLTDEDWRSLWVDDAIVLGKL
jgi:hypothetical protein